MNDATLVTRAPDDPSKAGAPGAHFDVLIVGAGLSGVGAACHLVRKRRGTNFAILEARDAIGGTWDLFRYPGIRSDSDMSTFRFAFRPWDYAKAIADGPSILRYLAETAEEYGVDRQIRFGHRVVGASWRSADARWTLDVRGPNGEKLRFSSNFLFMCTGYYEYAGGYMPGWPGMDRFAGRIVHPQKWPQDLRYDDKRVVVIGSGATAVTLVPAMAETAAHVVMLQRSPTYIVARPSKEAMAKRLRRWLPARPTRAIVRWKNIFLQMYLYRLSRRKPAAVKAQILKLAEAAIGPGFDAKHFSPRYNPWDQRMCLVPDGDLFAALRNGKASVVTGEIETFTETGLRLISGEELEADIIVTATGLKIRLMGGIAIEVDGAPVDVANTTIYKSAMFSDIPNLASDFRLYERLLDPQIRSDRRLCLPIAEPYGSPRLCGLQAAPGRRANNGGPDAAPHFRLYPEGEGPVAEARGEDAVAHESELCARRARLALRRDR